jgi:phosphoribosylformylglycinamidine synthase
LFSESTARALVTVAAGDDRLTSLLTERGVPYTEIGVVTDSTELVVEGVFTVSLAELDEAYEGTLPRLFG